MARDDDEFAEFAAAASARLRRAAYLLTGHDQQAEDAAQTALVKTYAAWSRIRRDDPYAYARKVLANHITDQWRRPIREHAGDDLPDRPGPRDLAEDVARQRWLLGALAALTERERLVVVMRHYFDMPEAEVAAVLNIAVGSVKSLNSRGLQKLRVSVRDDDEVLTAHGAPR
ncbi:SigE family RNA polymerase sigma factor [Actinoplanes sp. NPDC051343]|jgi:RNA polymerase sigma-70 factor (sigma-E family)|uniref:SigE family RNA polymerase sigma factor n=1 Tax=Actinoplanes sp. NPDC051343 TaxID=3363906 RepID=UPI0037AF10FB